MNLTHQPKGTMKTIGKMLLPAFLCLASLESTADIGVKSTLRKARLGYGIGATAPVGMPEGICGVNSFRLQLNPSIAYEFQQLINNGIGILYGIRIENKGMSEDARVKNYYMEMVRGEESLKGVFTGNVYTKVRQWMFTIPIQGTWSPTENTDIRFGPYVSLLFSKRFRGYAHNGHLRVGSPVGPKILIGEDEATRGYYDFSQDMRYLQWGVDLGADWYFHKDLGIYADICWGLSGVHTNTFKTIRQTLFPIFGFIGVTYRMK